MMRQENRVFGRHKVRREGSALLLTVSIVAVLTVTTLGSIAVRFDQFLATARLKDAEVAKSAAESGIELLNKKASTGSDLPSNTVAKVYDLTNSTEADKDDSEIAAFRPNPRKSLITIQKVKTNLPRCIAVGVLTPWTNDGSYLYADQTNSSPVLIFHYANIVSDTQLGALPSNTTAKLDYDEQQITISSLTNMGHFYNPYAPNGSDESSPNYWTIKMAGPEDEFLTRKSADNSNSYYKNLDIVYAPYLPRFTDGGLRDDYDDPGSFKNRTAEYIQTAFENIVKANNFKMWIDGAGDLKYVQRYGFGELFDDGSTQNAVNWVQPNLWNDSAEMEGLGNFYSTSNLDAGDVGSSTDWSKNSYPTYSSYPSSGWNLEINKGARPMSFAKFSSGSFTGQTSITGVLYGPTEGLRLNKYFSIVFYDSNTKQPILLKGGSTPGVWNNASITKLETVGTATNITISFAAALPARADGKDINLSDIYLAAINTMSQLSGATTLSVDLTNSTTATLSASSDCKMTTTSSGCPAVGDIVSFSKGSERLWAKVTETTFSDSGTKLGSFKVGGFYQLPKPVRSIASVTYGSGASATMAYYGGAINLNDYDGGQAAEVDELWLYQPESNSWTYKPNAGTSPGKLAGASLVYDAGNNRLLLYGGYRHETVGSYCGSSGLDYTKLLSCLAYNKIGGRVAKRLNSDIYSYSLASNTWSKLTTTSNPGYTTLTTGVDYQVQVLSTLGDRSGLEGWTWASVIPSAGSFLPNIGSTDTFTVNSVAGLAVGDDVFLDGKTSSNISILTAWAKVISIDNVNNRVTLSVYGFNGNGAAVSYSFINIRVSTRSPAASACQSSDGTTCSLGSQKPGYAIGDLVALERFDGGDLSDHRYAYIKDIDASGKLTFTATEPSGDDWKGAAAAAPKFAPTPRYGAQFSTDPRSGNSNLAYLWGGSQKNLNTYSRVAEIWQFNSTSSVWNFKAVSQPTDNETGYNMQFIHNAPGNNVYTSSLSDADVNTAIIKDKETSTTLPDGTVQISNTWDNDKVWTLELSNDTEVDEITVGSKVALERQLASSGVQGSREAFHGIVKDIPDYNGSRITVVHDPNYPGESGIGGDTANIKITVSNYLITFAIYKAGTANSPAFTEVKRTVSGLDITVNTLDPTKLTMLPNVGSTLVMTKREGTGNTWLTYSMTVTSRSITPLGGDSYRFSFGAAESRPTPSPISYWSSSNSLVSNGSSLKVTTTPGATFVAIEDVATAGSAYWSLSSASFDDKPQWKIYLPDSLTKYSINNVKAYPMARYAAAVGAIYYSSGESKVYSVGGSQGVYSTVWREEGVANDPNGGARPTWKMLKTSAQSASSLPELSGGVLSVYQASDGATKAVYFGGKYKSENSNLDYGIYNTGPARGMYVANNQEPMISGYYFAYSVNASSADTAQGFVDTIYDDFSSTISYSDDFRDSLRSVGGRADSVTVCGYVAELCTKNGGKDYGVQTLKLGTAGGRYDNSWSTTYAAINVGSAYLSDGGAGSLILSGPTIQSRHTSGRFDNDGYYPYQADTSQAVFGSLTTDYATDKTLLLAGYSEIKDVAGNKLGGAILLTPAGIAQGWLSAKTDSRGYSYVAHTETHYSDDRFVKDDGASTNRYLTNVPDPEDILFTFNAAKMLSSQNVYKVVGYYGSVRRGYLATITPGSAKVSNLIEIVP